MTEQHETPSDRRNQDALLSMLATLLKEQREMDAKLTKHIADEAIDFERMVASAMALAYPSGDAAGHRKHHEALITLAEEQAEFWKKMRLSVATWGILGILGFIAVSTWTHFLKGPQ